MKFLVSFIPRHVSNRMLLRIYQMLAAIPISKKVQEKNYNINIRQLYDEDWDFWNAPSSYIENQSEWDKIMYGKGKHHNMRWSGCEIIATFNALKSLTGNCSREIMAMLISEYEQYGAALDGEFGVSPRAIEKYFRKHGFMVATTYKDDKQSLDTVDRQCKVLIATVYNDAEDITKQIHTICITKEAGNGYVLHNAYCRDGNGTYIASVPYETLSDAVNKSSRYGAKLIYLIGVTVKK